MRRLSAAFALLLIAFLFGCQREVSYIGGPDVPTFTGETVTADPVTAALQGNVFDENGSPAAGVTVQAGSKTATTNSNGYFRINDAALDKKSAVVTAAKTGYFKAYRTFAATAGANDVEIKLVKRALTGSIDAAAGGEVSLSNGSKISLSAGGVVNAATTVAYTGSVKVYATYIDPSSSDIAQTVPGSFMATDKDGKRVTLTSYGMMAVELEGASGEKLQIKSGSTAKLTTAIPSATQASAPATIALWSVDETTGIWKEEGTATRSGNVYVGDVKHFSFWNCDVSANAVMLSMTLKNNDGNPLVHANVRIKRTSNNWAVYGFTDSLGQVSGYVPYNEALVMDVLDQCNASFYNQNIGPFTQATNLGTITITTPGTSVLTVKGKLADCSNAAVTNGHAVITYGYLVHYASVNPAGEFHTTFTHCASSPATVSILGIDAAAQQQSSAAVSVTATTSVTDAGTVSACGTSSAQFINYILDGTTFNLNSPADSLYGLTQVQGTVQQINDIIGFSMSSSARIDLEFVSTSQTSGTYGTSYISVNTLDSSMSSIQIPITLTNFPTTSGGFYEGSFSGTFMNRTTPHTINGAFRVKRK